MSHRGPWQVQPLGDEFVVQFLDNEDLRFGTWTAEEHATNFCRRLNKRWLRRGSALGRRSALRGVAA